MFLDENIISDNRLKINSQAKSTYVYYNFLHVFKLNIINIMKIVRLRLMI